MFEFQPCLQRFELDQNCSICLTFPKEQLKMKCCGSFLCRPCFDRALLRYGQCSLCSKSEYNLKDVSPNDTSVKMEICSDCDEEVAEKDFEAHKMCTKALVSEYEDKLDQQRLELEKSHDLKIMKLEFDNFQKNKLALQKMATKASKINDENDDLRKKSAAEEATIKNLKAEKNLAEDEIKNLHTLILTHRNDVLHILGYLGGNRIFDPNELLTGLQRYVSEEVCKLQEENGKQRHEIKKLRAKLGYIDGRRNYYG